MTHLFIEFSYLTASLLFIYGLRCLTHHDTARRGMHAAELGMLLAIIGTLLHKDIVTYEWIIAGLIIGGAIGGTISYWVPMTALPQRTALSHAFGALAASLVGVAKYHDYGAALGSFKMTAIGLEVLLGSLTATGSIIASLKLQGMLPGAPMTFKGQKAFNFTLIGVTVALFL